MLFIQNYAILEHKIERKKLAEKSWNKTYDKETLKELADSLKQSHVSIGQRIESSKENPFGFKYVKTIPPDEVAVLFLGGTGTEVKKGGDKSANGYLSTLEKYLKGHGLEEILQQQGKSPEIRKSIGLYSIIYNFGKDIAGRAICQTSSARENLYVNHKQILSFHKDEINKDIIRFNEEARNPHYIEELFNMAFLSRICDKNGKRLSLDEACKRTRNLTVCAHCHGAYTFLKIEERMQQMMRSLGYSREESDKIQSQLLCVALAPDAPLGVSKSKMISFASASDMEIRDSYYQKNNFKRIVGLILDLKEADKQRGIRTEGIRTSYFPGKRGEFFLTERIYKPGDDEESLRAEHNFLSNKDQELLTNGGKTLFNLAANILLSGIESSLRKTPLPSVEELACGHDEENKVAFHRLKRNGDNLWNKIRKVLHPLLMNQYRQKEH